MRPSKPATRFPQIILKILNSSFFLTLVPNCLVVSESLWIRCFISFLLIKINAPSRLVISSHAFQSRLYEKSGEKVKSFSPGLLNVTEGQQTALPNTKGSRLKNLFFMHGFIKKGNNSIFFIKKFNECLRVLPCIISQ